MKRIYYQMVLCLDSPLVIGSGESEITDFDVLKDKNGYSFIPATSLSGVLLRFCPNQIVNSLFGIYLDDKGHPLKSAKQSVCITYDAYQINENEQFTSERDGVALGLYREKIEGAKFNFEIVEPSTTYLLRFELVKPTVQEIETFEMLLARLINKEVRLGHKTTRGYGKVYVDAKTVKKKEIHTAAEYISFEWKDLTNLETYKVERNYHKAACLTIEFTQYIPKQLSSGLSIKQYSVESNDADYHQIESKYHGKNMSVVPGTSWAGVFKSGMIKNLMLLSGLDKQLCLRILEQYFGDSEKNKSKIYFDESLVMNSKSIEVARVKINRFHGGSEDSALFDEYSTFLGNLELNIELKMSKDDVEVIKGLLLLVLKDFQEKLCSIGGGASIGRGLLGIKSVVDENGTTYNLNDKISAPKLVEFINRIRRENA